MTRDFTWRDGERIDPLRPRLGGRGAGAARRRVRPADDAARDGVRARVVAATPSRSITCRPGRVDEVAGDLLDVVDGALLVALGGGRVVDVAKALAAARGARGRRDPDDA